jgi:hypothetical protein
MSPIKESSTNKEKRPIPHIRAKRNIRPKYLQDFVTPKKMNIEGIV